MFVLGTSYVLNEPYISMFSCAVFFLPVGSQHPLSLALHHNILNDLTSIRSLFPSRSLSLFKINIGGPKLGEDYKHESPHYCKPV